MKTREQRFIFPEGLPAGAYMSLRDDPAHPNESAINAREVNAKYSK